MAFFFVSGAPDTPVAFGEDDEQRYHALWLRQWAAQEDFAGYSRALLAVSSEIPFLGRLADDHTWHVPPWFEHDPTGPVASVATGTDGTFAASLGLTSAFAGSSAQTGTFAASLGLTSAFAGSSSRSGTFSAALSLSAALAGSTAGTSGTFAAALGLTAAFLGSAGAPVIVVQLGDDVPRRGDWHKRRNATRLEELAAEIAALETATPAKRKKRAKQIAVTYAPEIQGADFKPVRDGLRQLADGRGWHNQVVAKIEMAVADERRRLKRRRNEEAAWLLLI